MKCKTILFSLFIIFILSGNIAMAAPPALQTQYGPNGIEVDLIRAKISGKVLSVAFNFRNAPDKSYQTVDYLVGEVNFIDDLNSQKYTVLKDAEGKYSSGPISYTRDDPPKAVTHIPLSKNGSKIIWYKFPAPPEGTKTIQINLPEVSPFDEVEISK